MYALFIQYNIILNIIPDIKFEYKNNYRHIKKNNNKMDK